MSSVEKSADVADQQDVKQSWRTSVDSKGAFVRKESQFRHWITADGSSGFQAEANRYHLYVSLACPWAHRTLILRALKGLEDNISVTVVDWLLGPNGWAFTDKKPKCSLDTVNNCNFLREVYAKSDPSYSGNITVPCLWDKLTNKVVNNESSEIIRMLNSEFQAFCKTPEQLELNLYPEHLKEKIDGLNAWIYPEINNGVYKCGFAKSQEAYDEAVAGLFIALDKVEDLLSHTRYLTGPDLTEADIRLFTTLIRFDTVYHTHFKTNKKRIVDYPNLWGFVRDIYQLPGVADTVDQEHIMKHYFASHLTINPTGIVPVGPELDLMSPHHREKM
ncbi:glutathionyl-hydroquinone reductase YqjG-like [Physella acuta]|uniref:glutathionyl-hydroquinone reductase YqjG-like n=1 Tax=Physella acuta TaxID=109671 RepID=UPI0027DE6CD6|nr:glutathionyl-hydroquinone reductase YqjG-like [Physella acuta]XP_059153999.1 glutathionyl-hydroquinone reductase YqjG-like [Physella acuta]XP_059154000.1 glutathionyl-hydroquinone reductase YqjG-like [Physella acuta]